MSANPPIPRAFYLQPEVQMRLRAQRRVLGIMSGLGLCVAMIVAISMLGAMIWLGLVVILAVLFEIRRRLTRRRIHWAAGLVGTVNQVNVTINDQSLRVADTIFEQAVLVPWTNVAEIELLCRPLSDRWVLHDEPTQTLELLLHEPILNRYTGREVLRVTIPLNWLEHSEFMLVHLRACVPEGVGVGQSLYTHWHAADAG